MSFAADIASLCGLGSSRVLATANSLLITACAPGLLRNLSTIVWPAVGLPFGLAVEPGNNFPRESRSATICFLTCFTGFFFSRGYHPGTLRGGRINTKGVAYAAPFTF